jgi:hypothetical protein
VPDALAEPLLQARRVLQLGCVQLVAWRQGCCRRQCLLGLLLCC